MSIENPFSEKEIPEDNIETENIHREKIKVEKREKNREVLQKAQEINAMSFEDLSILPEEERVMMVKNLTWDEFINSEREMIPPEILNAEAHIYETYKPSEGLMLEHQKANDLALAIFGAEELFSIKKKWENMDLTEKKEITQKYVDGLKKAYGLPEGMVVAVLEKPLGCASASYIPSFYPDEMGSLILYETSMAASFEGQVTLLSHEMSHAYQEALLKKFVQPASRTEKDVEWLSPLEDSNRHEQYITNGIRYRISPKETGAYLSQYQAQDHMNEMIDAYTTRILEEHKLPPLKQIEQADTVSHWVKRMIEIKKIKPGDLMQELSKSKLNGFHKNLIEKMYKDKTEQEIIEIMNTSFSQKEQVDKLLGI